MSRAKQKKPEPEPEQHTSSAYKSERIDLDYGLVSIKYPIRLTKDRLHLMDKICETLNERPDVYLAQALFEKIDSDLHNPQELGGAFCLTLLKEWNMNNDTNDHRVLRNNTQKILIK